MSSTDSGPRGAVRKQEATDVSCSGLRHEESAAGFKWQVKGTSSQWCLIPENHYVNQAHQLISMLIH